MLTSSAAVDPLHPLGDATGAPDRRCNACLAEFAKARVGLSKPDRTRMAPQKLYAGTTLRELRSRVGLTQKAFADKAGRLAALSQPDGEQPPPRFGGRRAGAGAGIRFRRDGPEHAATTSALSATCARRWPIRSLAPPRRPWPTCALPPRTPRRWRAPSSTCTAPTGRRHERLASLDEALGRDDCRPAPLALGGGAGLLPLLRQLPRRGGSGRRTLRHRRRQQARPAGDRDRDAGRRGRSACNFVDAPTLRVYDAMQPIASRSRPARRVRRSGFSCCTRSPC